VIRDIGLVGGSVSGKNNVGGLVGYNTQHQNAYKGSISNAYYATGERFGKRLRRRAG
jgi:hypothetical protein